MPFDDGKKTVRGSIAHTDDAATKVPFVSLKCGIEPTLTGVSQVVATQTGENLFDKTTVTDNTWIVVNDTTTESAVGYRTSDYIPVKANTKYFVSTKSSNRSAYYDQNKNGIAYFSFSGGQSFNCLYDGYIRITIKNDVDLDTFIVNEGNTAITYEPYNGATHTASLGRTIHGGTADIVKGEGVELVKKKTISSFSGTYGAVNNGYAYYISDADTTHNTSVVKPIMMIANQLFTYGSASRGSAPTWQYGGNDGNNQTHTFILPSEYDTLAKANNFLSSLETPLEVTLTLATPETFTFTPITPTPETVGKVNNVYCNTGNTELTYHDNAHGFSEVTVNKTGKNLFDISKVATTGTTAGISWSVSGNEITISGTATSSGWKTLVDFKLPHKGTYHFHMNATGNVGYFLRGWTQLVGKDVTEVCNDPSQVYRIAIAVTTAGQTYEGTISEIQIEVGDAYTSYEPYEAVSKTAYLHKVIYGGQADVVRGICEPRNFAEFSNEANANRSSYEYTTESPELIEWTKTGDGGKFYARFVLHIPKPGKYTISCSADSTLKVKYIYSDELWGTAVFPNVSANPFVADFSESGDYVLGFYAGSSATSGTLKEVICEKGETKTDYAPYSPFFTFPPISMETDDGENTLFATEGDSAITYRKDTE